MKLIKRKVLFAMSLLLLIAVCTFKATGMVTLLETLAAQYQLDNDIFVVAISRTIAKGHVLDTYITCGYVLSWIGIAFSVFVNKKKKNSSLTN